ncbi:MAG: hypothetical protein V1911_03850 [Candidatus Micrarchaeota archaeon]
MTDSKLAQKLAQKLEGRKTIKGICSELGIKRGTAVYYVSMMRKNGFVHQTIYTKPERTYVIKPCARPAPAGGLVEALNRVLPKDFQIDEPYEHYVWGPYSFEDALVSAVRTKKARFILGSILLFRKVSDWKLLMKMAGGEKRKIGALYDLARREIPKVPRMDKRTYRGLLRAKVYDKYLISKAGPSEDYKDLSKKWGIFIPFTKKDMNRLR